MRLLGKKNRVLKLKKNYIKGILVLSIILFSFILMPFFNKIDINDNSLLEDQKDIKNEDLQVENLKTQDLASDITFTGIGSAWNVTHYANRTKTNMEVSFNSIPFWYP